jgi:hypothetical protein
MPLSGDQRAMLQLLLERGQSYDDIASLLGLGTDEVRARARGALQEIGGTDPDAQVGLTDYLLGQADPIGRADVARHLQSDPETRDLADKLAAQLRVLAPAADLPEIPAAKDVRPARARRTGPAPGAAPEPKPAHTPATGAGAGLSSQQRKLIGGLIGGGLVVILIVLLAAGVFGGDDSGDGGTETTAEASEPDEGGATGATGDNLPAGNAAGRTFAILEPQGDSEARGAAQFGRIRQRAYLQVDIAGLPPSPEGQNYVIWFYGSDRSAFPLSFERVGENGQLRGLAPIPAEVLGALQQGLFRFIDVSLTDVSELRAALRQARGQRQPPPYVGESILRGRIQGPGAEAASAPPSGGGTTGATGPTGG